MMDNNEIKENYLDIYTDIFKLLQHFERVQKPTNDVVGKFFGTALVAGMSLAEISDVVNKQKLTSEIIDKFFEDSKPGDITMRFSDINQYISSQRRFKERVGLFFSTDYTFDTPTASTTNLDDIDVFTTRQTSLNAVVYKFCKNPPVVDLTLAEINDSVIKQKRISEIVDKFFEAIKPGDITTKISDIDKYVRDRDQLRI